MTDEEKAIDYAKTECCKSCTDSCKKTKCKMFCNVRNAVLYGLAERRKNWEGSFKLASDIQHELIVELKAQIEKMKCCENCKKCRTGNCTEDSMFYARTTGKCDKCEMGDERMTEKEKLNNFINEVCEVLGIKTPLNILKVAAATTDLFDGLQNENKELKEKLSLAGYRVAELKNEIEELKIFCKKLIKTNNELRDSLRKYEVVPDVDYLPNGSEVYKENIGDNPYGIK